MISAPAALNVIVSKWQLPVVLLAHGPVASGIDAHITFETAVAVGDTLVARAVEVQRSRRIGVYRIDVVREDGSGETPVSSFTGTVYIHG